MGHRKTHAPKHGSLAYLPRHRAKKPVARIRYWPKITATTPRLLGFTGYKAGMTYVFTIEDRKRSPNFGKEVMRAATVIETPPILICGIRTYTHTPYGLQHLTEAWMKDPPAELERALVMPETFNTEEMLQKIQNTIDQTTTHPRNRRHTTPTNQPIKEKTRHNRNRNRRSNNPTTTRIRKNPPKQNSNRRRSLQRRTIHRHRRHNHRQRLPRPSQTLGSSHPPTQRTKNQTRRRHTRPMEPPPRHVLSPTRRTNGLPPTHRIQQTHPQNRQRRQRSHRQRRLHPLRTSQRTLHPHRRQRTRHRKTHNPPTTTSKTTKRNTRNTTHKSPTYH